MNIDFNQYSIDVITTLYKRANYNEQIQSLLNQSKKPRCIYVYQNDSHVEFNLNVLIKQQADSLKIPIRHIHSKDMNFKFHGRFTIPLLLDSDYVAIFDDDTIPGENWLANCLSHSVQLNCLVGANGRILRNPKHKLKETGLDPNDVPSKQPILVDYVGHCWFFKREWIHYMWINPPKTMENGEDIHLAASLKIYGGISTYLAQQPMGRRDLWGDTKPSLGWDDHATYKKPKHKDEREDVIQYWIEKGWKSAYDLNAEQMQKMLIEKLR